VYSEDRVSGSRERRELDHLIVLRLSHSISNRWAPSNCFQLNRFQVGLFSLESVHLNSSELVNLSRNKRTWTNFCEKISPGKSIPELPTMGGSIQEWAQLNPSLSQWLRVSLSRSVRLNSPSICERELWRLTLHDPSYHRLWRLSRITASDNGRQSTAPHSLLLGATLSGHICFLWANM